MATNQYPTNNVSNALRQANASTSSNKAGPTYAQPTNQYLNNTGMQRNGQPYNSPSTVTQGPTQRTYGNSPLQYSTDMGMQPRTTNPYSSDYGRGGAPGSTRQPTYQPDPLPGGIPNKDSQPYYNPSYPQYNPQGTGQQATPNQFSYYQGLDPTTLQSNAEREAALQAVQANVPIWQLGQNSYQYSQDFNEAQRRWNEQFNYQQGLDQYNMDLSGRQQTMAEWQASQAANQWAQDFNRQTGNDQWQQQFSQQQFGLQDYQTREQLNQSAQQMAQQAQYQQGQLGIGNRELDIRDQYQQGQLQQGNRQLDIQQQLGLGNIDVQRQQNAINEAYNTGRLTNEARQIALAELAQGQNYGIQQGQLDISRGQLGVAQQANQIDQMYKSGQLDLGQRNAALAELTQQQTYGLQMAQLSTQQQEQARRFGLDFSTQQALEQYRQQELMQQAQLAREQMAAQQQQSLLAATGRNQRANVRWMRAT